MDTNTPNLLIRQGQQDALTAMFNEIWQQPKDDKTVATLIKLMDYAAKLERLAEEYDGAKEATPEELALRIEVVSPLLQARLAQANTTPGMKLATATP